MKVNQFDPYLTEDEVASLAEVIRDNWITEGKRTEEFQKLLKEYCRAKHVILLPNGTLALYVALMILGVGSKDEVILPDFTFVGSATAVALTGAKPVFADVNRNDFNIDIDSLKRCISKRTKAIMPVHIYGQSANMKEIMQIARDRNFKVVEDAAQGLGVTFDGQHVGTFGDIGCMSFYADKTITTGEGGAILTNSDSLAEKCMYFKNQGRLQRGSFIHPYMGFNFRITDLQAAIGVVQMKKLSFLIDRKSEIESQYKELLKDVPRVEFPVDTKAGQRVPFRINILVEDPEALQNYLMEKEIATRRFFYPLHRQPCFTNENAVKLSEYPNTEYIFKHGLSLPSGSGLTADQIRYACASIKEYYTAACQRT